MKFFMGKILFKSEMRTFLTEIKAELKIGHVEVVYVIIVIVPFEFN